MGTGVTHSASEADGPLCSKSWIHYYRHPLLAAFMNSVHGGFKQPIIWSVKVEGATKHAGQLKSGAKSVTTLQKIDLPLITAEQRVEIAVRCALLQYKEPTFVSWAEDWISGKARSAWAATQGAATPAAWAAADAAAATHAAADAACAADAAAAAADFDLLSIIKSVVERAQIK